MTCPAIARPYRTLLVEDEAVLALDTKGLLEKAGCQVTWVTSGTAAVRAFSDAIATDSTPDLVIMDVRLAGVMDGAEAAARIRDLDAEVIIIFATCETDGRTFDRAAAAQPRAFVEKPLSSDWLRDTVAAIAPR